MRRYLTFLVSALLLFSFAARAADPLCSEYQYGDAGWFKTKEEACDAWASKTQGTQGNNPTFNFRNWRHSISPGVGSPCTLGWDFSYVGTSDWSSTGMSSGHVQTRQVVCEVCKPGPKGSVNVTVGYHATPSTNIKLNPFVKVDPFFKQLEKDQGGTMCYQGCKVGVPFPDEGAEYWISQVAGPNGLYRSSATIDIQGTSQQCSEATPDAATSTATPPACPGATGTVNGATVCLPSTTDTTPGTAPTDAIRGNPSAGPTDPSKPTSERAPGPGGAGNGSGTGGASNGGAASGGPATGSNNTPGGKGCNDGTKSPTPACSGKGELDADGNTDKPEEGKEQAACGAPGQPKCRIDETGTPGEVGGDKYDSKLDAYKNDSKDAADQIKGSGTGIYDSWTSLFVAPPLASCEGFEFPAHAGQSMGTVDPCNVVDGIRTAMAYLWAIGGFWLCLGWVKQANT